MGRDDPAFSGLIAEFSRRLGENMEEERRGRKGEVLIVAWMYIGSIAIFLALLHYSGAFDVVKFTKENQQFVGSLLGVVITGMFTVWSVLTKEHIAAGNARIEKELDVAHERDTVRRAITAELNMLRDVLEFRLKKATDERATAGDFSIPKYTGGIEQSRVYLALIDKVRLLSKDKIEAMVRAYSSYEACVAVVKMLAEE